MSLVDDLITMTSAAASEQDSFSSAISGVPVTDVSVQTPEIGTWEDIGYGWKGNTTTGMVLPAGRTSPVFMSSLNYEDFPVGEGDRRQLPTYDAFDPSGALLHSENYEAPLPSWKWRPLLLPGEEQSSGPFGTSLVEGIVNAGSKVTNAIGNAVDYTMEEVVGSDLMKDISELTPLLSKAILTYVGGAPLLGAMTALETGAKGGDLQDTALNSLVAYLSAVGSQYAGAAMGGGSTPTTEAQITQPNVWKGPGDVFQVDPELAAFSETMPKYVEPTTPYMFGEGAAPATVNPGLVYENTAAPFVFGGGATPFKVNTALDPNATPVSSGAEWLDYIKWGKQLAKLLAGGSETGGEGGFGTVTEQLPGRSPDMSNLIELISGGSSTKPSRITSSEVPLLPYGATLLEQNQMEKYNPQQLYYS